MVDLLQFYVEILIFIRNQVCYVHSLPLKMHIFLFVFSTKIISEKYSSKCVKFHTSWFCDVKLQLDIFVDLSSLEIFFNFL
jgi:hypothetical protein